MKNIFPNNRLGTIIKNLDFIFWDLIKHPIASIIKEKISSDISVINITLKLTKKILDAIFSKSFI